MAGEGSCNEATPPAAVVTALRAHADAARRLGEGTVGPSVGGRRAGPPGDAWLRGAVRGCCCAEPSALLRQFATQTSMPSVTLSSKTGGHVSPVMCVAAYFAALQSAVLVTTTPRLIPAAVGSDAIWQGLYADVCATVVVFAFSYVLDNTSVYDPFWPIAPCALTAFWARGAMSASVLGASQWWAVALVWLWALRLLIGVPWRGWTQGLEEEDWRYVEIRSRTGGGLRYWAASLLSLHLTPTLLVFATLRPFGMVITAIQKPLVATLTRAEAFAALLCVVAIVVEGVADEQLRRFRQSDAYRGGGCCERGLWRFSRHPKCVRS